MVRSTHYQGIWLRSIYDSPLQHPILGHAGYPHAPLCDCCAKDQAQVARALLLVSSPDRRRISTICNGAGKRIAEQTPGLLLRCEFCSLDPFLPRRNSPRVQLSFFTAIQPMCYTWASQNTAGHTKKLCTTGIVFVAQCAGNIVGPLLYRTEDAPFYHPGLIAK